MLISIPRDVQESINTTGMLNATFLNASYFQYNIVPVIFSYLFELTFFIHSIRDAWRL